MYPTPVDRFTFTVAEVVAAILPSVGHGREIELRVDADGYVVVDIVQPRDREKAAAAPEAKAKEEKPVERPATTTEASKEQGPAESEARELCKTSLFRVFLEVKTEEAALKLLPERCHVKQLVDLDRTRSTALNLRHVVEEYEAWKIT